MRPAIDRYKYRQVTGMSGVLDDLGLGIITPTINNINKTMDNINVFTVSVSIAVWVLGGLAVTWLWMKK